MKTSNKKKNEQNTQRIEETRTIEIKSNQIKKIKTLTI